MKVFTTKYALTSGIAEIDVEAPRDSEPYVYDRRTGYWAQYRLGRDAFEERADAVANANNRVKKKIAALRKSIAQFEATKFE